jgi:hypothetical protein
LTICIYYDKTEDKTSVIFNFPKILKKFPKSQGQRVEIFLGNVYNGTKGGLNHAN